MLLVLSSTYHFLKDDSLQSADKINKKAVLWQGNRTYDAVVKIDTYRNYQQHRAVLPAIARLSCYSSPMKMKLASMSAQIE